MKKIVPFAKAFDTKLYGAKAVGLGEAIRKNIPVPPGIAISGDMVDAIASGDPVSIHKLAKAMVKLSAPYAVRSSAIDEDGADASFAGQHLTKLNVHSAEDLPGAISEVWWSANSDSAITYRQKVGLFKRPSVGVVVQTLLNPDSAGVMFTENPVTGADERTIEASYGLGEAVVAGLVIPDFYRINRANEILERKAGHKAISIRSLPNGGTYEQNVPQHEVNALCLNDKNLVDLSKLALLCEKAYGPSRDIEWAIQNEVVYLLQCRSITTGKDSKKKVAPITTNNNPIVALYRVSLFADMSRSQVEQIARVLKFHPFSKGDTIIMEGSGGAACFLIDSGEALVTRKGVQITTLKAGDIMGELAMIDGGPRSATVTALSDMGCYGLTFWEFRPLLDKNQIIAWKLIQALAKRLRHTTENQT